jgi:hypothetical protein
VVSVEVLLIHEARDLSQPMCSEPASSPSVHEGALEDIRNFSTRCMTRRSRAQRCLDEMMAFGIQNEAIHKLDQWIY